MGIQVVGPSGTLAGVGEEANKPLHITSKALPATVGHYRTAVKLTMATTQAANSRLFEIRNTHSTNLLVLTRCWVSAMPTGTVTTAYAGEIGLFRCTTFNAVDTANTVTPTTSVKRSSMTAYPGNAAVRHVTIAGAAAGMTGGTLTKDANQSGSLVFNAITAAAGTTPTMREMVDDINGTHPFVFAQNEGFELENVVVGSGTANVIQVIIDVSWAEVTAY
jgi:hypothetical protein